MQRGRKGPDREFFMDLLGDLPSDMRGKYKDLFLHYCTVLQLGRHESGQEETQQVPVQQKDARLAIILGQAILEYISRLH